jgi:hypothetical protein
VNFVETRRFLRFTTVLKGYNQRLYEALKFVGAHRKRIIWYNKEKHLRCAAKYKNPSR